MRTKPIVYTGFEDNPGESTKKMKEKKSRSTNQRNKDFYYIQKVCGACMDDVVEIMNEIRRY